MTILYNCKHSGDQYRITKFTSDFDVEASYLCDLHSCECPAGHRPKCRHREMLPKFIAREAIGSNWFFDHDRGGWVQGWKEEPSPQGFDREMQAALEADGAKLAALTGEDHGPYFASEALPIQPTPEPSPEVTEDMEAIRDFPAPSGRPSPSPTIRRRV